MRRGEVYRFRIPKGIGHEQQCALGVITQETLKQSRLQSQVMKNVAVQSPTGDMLVNQMRSGSLDAAVAYLSNAAGSADHLDAVLTVLAELGTVNIRRAYGNWSKAGLKGWAEMTHRHAIEPHQQFDITKGKNATDMKMTIDAMDLLFGGDFDYGRGGLALVALGMGCHLAAGTLNHFARDVGLETPQEAVDAVREVSDNMIGAIDESLKKRPYTTLALAVGAIAYHLMHGSSLHQSVVFFIGVPAVLAVILSLTPKAKSAAPAGIPCFRPVIGEEEIEAVVAASPRPDLVDVVGWVEDLPATYRAASAFVVTPGSRPLTRAATTASRIARSLRRPGPGSTSRWRP